MEELEKALFIVKHRQESQNPELDFLHKLEEDQNKGCRCICTDDDLTQFPFLVSVHLSYISRTLQKLSRVLSLNLGTWWARALTKFTPEMTSLASSRHLQIDLSADSKCNYASNHFTNLQNVGSFENPLS